MAWIYGAGGHGKVILEILQLNRIPVEGFMDDNCLITQFMGYKVVRPSSVSENSIHVILGIGSNDIRKQLTERYAFNYLTATHPTAIVSRNSIIGEGTVLMAGAIIQSGCIIGNHVIVNTGSIIDHDCVIGDFVHISPGVTLCGEVKAGDCVWIGAGSTIIQCTRIGESSIIGAGSVIRKSVPPGVVMAGNPPRIIRYPNHLPLK